MNASDEENQQIDAEIAGMKDLGIDVEEFQESHGGKDSMRSAIRSMVNQIGQGFGFGHNGANQNGKLANHNLLEAIHDVTNDRISQYGALVDLEQHYLVRAIYEVLYEEVLKDSGTGTRITVNCKKEKYNDAIQDFMDEFNIEQMVSECLPELFHYGDYTFKVRSGLNKGILSIEEPYLPGEVVSVYNGSSAVGYWRIPRMRQLHAKKVASRGQSQFMHQAEELTYDKVWHISLGVQKKKVAVSEDAGLAIGSPYIRTGRSVIDAVIDRLQLLNFKEVSDNAHTISRLTRPTLVGIQIPPTETGASAMTWMSKFEKLLNSGVKDPEQQMRGSKSIIASINSIMSYRYKVVPSFASGRGTMQKLPIEDDIMRAGTEKIDQVDRERQLILTMVGMPPELALPINGNDKSDNQRLYTRLSKRTKNIQQSIAQSLAHLLTLHISTKFNDGDIDSSDFEIIMNTSTNLEDADDKEVLGYALENIQSVLSIGEALTSAGVNGMDGEGNPRSAIDPKKMLEYAKSELRGLGVAAVDVFVEPEAETVPDAPIILVDNAGSEEGPAIKLEEDPNPAPKSDPKKDAAEKAEKAEKEDDKEDEDAEKEAAKKAADKEAQDSSSK